MTLVIDYWAHTFDPIDAYTKFSGNQIKTVKVMCLGLKLNSLGRDGQWNERGESNIPHLNSQVDHQKL